MGRGSAVYLSYTALVLLSAVSTASAGLWDVDIDLGPAPSPEDGPPFSAHATRNRALLPYQIIGIVGAYLATVLILYTLLFTVGRKARKRAQTMAERPTEMVKPMTRTFEMSPSSPNSAHGWLGRLRSKTSINGSIRSGTSQVGSPLGNIDPQIVERDRLRDQEALSELYGAAFKFDDQRSQQDVTNAEANPPQYSRSKPTALTVGRPDLQRIQTGDSYPQSPMTPKSPVRVIYPPPNLHPDSAAFNAPLPTQNPSQAQLSQGESRHGRGSSFGSSKGAESVSSSAPAKTRKGILRKSIKDIKISSPIQRLRDDDNSDGARTPLSPRQYMNPGVPPEPPTARTMDSEYQNTPGTAVSASYSEMQAQYEQLDEIRALPQPAPQRVRYDEQDVPLPRIDTTKHVSPKRSATNVNSTLPFRQNNYSQQRGNAFPTSPAGDWNFNVPRSPGPMSPPMKSPSIRERVLEVGNGNRLAAPYTGCATPYSPYMPFSPVTPITPHLQTRAERKQRQKEERALRGAATEKDKVADDKDMWGSAY